MSSIMSQHLPVVTYVLGGWDLSICGDLLLQGTLFAQFAHYITLYKSDIAALRAFVYGLFFLTTLKTVQCIAIMWTQNVRYFADIGSAAGMFNDNWLEQINLGFVAFLAFYVQVFYCQRLWALSKNVYVVIVVFAMFLFSLVAAFVAVAFTFANNDRNRTWIAVHLGTVFAGDLILCGSTTYFLLKHSKQVLPQTAGMLNAILKLTFQSAAPAAICALVNLIGSQAGSHSQTANAYSMIAIIANDALPKLYAISAMWTLNSRKDILLARSAGQNTSSTEGRSGGLSGGRRTGANGASGARPMELGALSLGGKVQRIQVRTQVQTMHHTDDNIFAGHDDGDLKTMGIEEVSLDAESGSTRKG
ncbi:hypothetical protein C8F01DRAFT_383679 [Mycena amicta]|nr:hypothetical protein C8F01DRAFT_383679 [Mycena amicta]